MIIPPYQRMETWYQMHPAVRPFGLYVEWHLQAGVVLSTPDCFAMGRPVNSKAGDWRITESMQLWPRDKQDCWYIFAMCGDMAKAFSMLPYELPLIAFQRKAQKELRFYPLNHLRSLCGRSSSCAKPYA